MAAITAPFSEGEGGKPSEDALGGYRVGEMAAEAFYYSMARAPIAAIPALFREGEGGKPLANNP
jgi:hypothetical protein